MKDEQIVELYWKRSEMAIEASARKYGAYCQHIAYGILHNHSDAEECVNDAYLAAWNAIPPHRPTNLATFLGKLTRRISLKRYEQNTAAKRGGGQTDLVLEELAECLGSTEEASRLMDDMVIRDVLHKFLTHLPDKKRRIFLQRYWYMRPIGEIAKDFRMSESGVKMILSRARENLKKQLEKEGISHVTRE